MHRSASRLDVTFTRSRRRPRHRQSSTTPPTSRRRPVHVADRVGALGGQLAVNGESSRAVHPVRVVVADDALLTREGIVHLLAGAGVDVVAQAEDADALLREVAAPSPTSPSSTSGCHRPTPTKVSSPPSASATSTPTSACSCSPSTSSRATPCGCSRTHPEKVGYLLKERVFAAAVLVDALRRVDEGETVVDPTIVSRLVRPAPPTTIRSPTLTAPRTRSPRPRRRRPVEQGDRRPALRRRTHRRGPRHPDLPQARPRRARPTRTAESSPCSPSCAAEGGPPIGLRRTATLDRQRVVLGHDAPTAPDLHP